MSVMIGTAAVEAWPIEAIPWLAVDQVIQQWAPVEGATRGLVWVSNYLVGASTRALSLVWIVNFWGWVVNFSLVVFFIFWIEVLVRMWSIVTNTVVREWDPMLVSLEKLSWSGVPLSMVAAKTVVFKAQVCSIPRKVFVKKTFIQMGAVKKFLGEVRAEPASFL